MNIFLINFILMIVEAWILLYNPRRSQDVSENIMQRNKKWFVILQCLQWVLISCLRSDSVGADTINYTRIFELHKDVTWKECFEYFKSYYFDDDLTYGFEPGYLLFEKIVASIWPNQWFYKFVVAVIFMSALGPFVYNNSDDPFIAFMLYSGLFYNMFSLTGYRQAISVSIGILCSYKYLKQRKFFKFVLLVLIAATIHKSTLIFIVFYFISQKRISTAYTIISVTSIILMIVFRAQLFNYVKEIVGYDEYGVGFGFTQRNFLLLFAVISIVAIWRYPLVMEKWPESKMYYNGLIMSAAMIPFAMVSPTSMRLVYDFGFTLMMLVPKVFHSFADRRDVSIAYICSGLIFGYFIATKAVPYEFFWQAM